MSRTYFTAPDVGDFPPSNQTAVTASATETNLWLVSRWTPISALDMKAGKWYIVEFGGKFTSTSTQGLLTWTLRVGQSATPASNISLGASNVTAPPASLTNAPFMGRAIVGVRSVGVAASAATLAGTLFVHVQGAAAATAVDYIAGGTVPTNVDDTVAQGIAVSLTISVASQSYQCDWVTIRSAN